MPHRFAEEDEVYEIELEFLGKDSMLFKQTIDFSSYGTNGVKVYRNLEDFTKKKKPAEDVFETLSVRRFLFLVQRVDGETEVCC